MAVLPDPGKMVSFSFTANNNMTGGQIRIAGTAIAQPIRTFNSGMWRLGTSTSNKKYEYWSYVDAVGSIRSPFRWS